MRVIEGTNQAKVNETPAITAFINSSTAPSIETSFESNPPHNVQLARQVKSQLSLLEETHQRMAFMLREVSGIVKKVK